MISVIFKGCLRFAGLACFSLHYATRLILDFPFKFNERNAMYFRLCPPLKNPLTLILLMIFNGMIILSFIFFAISIYLYIITSKEQHPPPSAQATTGFLALKYEENTRDKIAISLIRIFKLGPLVSFNGSPIVSPITAALWISLCLLIAYPFSSISRPA